MSNFKNPFLRKTELMNDNGKMVETITEDQASKQGTLDPNMIAFEVYNPMKISLWFTEMESHGRRIFEVKPDSFQLIPHNYFIVWNKEGETCNFIRHYGSAKFQGKKTASSF